MASINKVIIIGNLGRDPELRNMPNGDPVVAVSLATTRKWKDKSGDRQEETEWHRVVAFGRLAEIIQEYTQKGDPLYVEGRLKTRKWTDKDGVEKYTTEIIAEQVQLMGSRDSSSSNSRSRDDNDRGGRDNDRNNRDHGNGRSRDENKGSSKTSAKRGGFDDMDDIPF